MKQKVSFVTGTGGQAAYYLIKLLLSKGHRVVGMMRRNANKNVDNIKEFLNNPDFVLEEGNMQDGASLWNLLSKYHPDEIYNLAAQSHVHTSFSVSEETVDVVGLGTLRLLNAYREVCPEARFIQASSSEMFGENTEAPQNESSKMLPASPYACAKLFAHNICRNYRASYGLHISSMIFFNYESEKRGENFVTRKITLAAARIKVGLQEELSLGNLDAKRDWGYAEDYMEACYLAAQQLSPDDYVISTGETHTVREFLEETFRLAGLSVEKYVSIDGSLFRPQEVPLLLGNSEKARKTLNWEPKVKFKELVKRMYDSDWNKACREINSKNYQ